MTTHTETTSTPRIVARPMQNDDDFWKIRDLLIETYPITGPGFNWEIRHWDGSRFYNAEPALNPQWKETVRLWETEDGRLAGAAHDDNWGCAVLELHPDYRHLIEEDMIAWAEGELFETTEDGERRLTIYVYEYDAPRRRLLEARGYKKMDQSWVLRRMRFGNKPLPRRPIAPGYTMRTTRPGDEGDFQRIADLLNTAFRRTFHSAAEYRTFTRLAPSFRHDLDMVVEAPDGTFAAHVGVIYDEANRRALFEPVSTHPDHRRKGLAQALMFEGLHRAKALGAAEITVETGDAAPANALYDSIGFTEAYKGFAWRKVF